MTVRFLPVCAFLLLADLVLSNANAAEPRSLSLPSLSRWSTQDATVVSEDDLARVSAPVNYKVGRVTSPSSPARLGELFTVAAEVSSQYRIEQGEYYEAWLEIEFLSGKKTLLTAASPKLIGTQPQARLLAVTAAAPAEADSVRASVCVQNKRWNIVDNEATVRAMRLLKLEGERGKALTLEVAAAFKRENGARTAELAVKGKWPDGTAVRIESDRGTAPPTVLLESGAATAQLAYAESEVGSAAVVANVLGESASLHIADPKAATLTLRSVIADGTEIPVRIRLTHDEEMLPGRYQEATPGIFVTPSWSVDLAPGKWQVRISKGPQFKSFMREVVAKSGETVNLGDIRLERIVDLPKLGWYGGDADGDVYHGELIYQDVNADTALEISHAMGLDWVGVGRWGVRDLGGPHPKTWGEGREFMQSRSRQDFLFVWTDERPKSDEGHACFVGLERPDADRFEWGWSNAKTPLHNFQELQMVRASGAATFANHPLRWWMNGGRFRTNMYSSLPFDLCATGLLDGVNVNDKPENVALWSMLLDHGYRVSATAGADFGLDRPGGPVPGHHRMYCNCPEGLTAKALADAVRNGQTIVSTGPTLVADLEGQPPGALVAVGKTYTIKASAWARGDENDPLRRLELWSHGKAVEAKTFDKGAARAEATFEWKPKGEWDWVAVRATSLKGFALTSAFYAKSEGYTLPKPVRCELTLQVQGVSEQELAKSTIEVWDGAPGVAGSELEERAAFKQRMTLDVPASATILVRLPDGRAKETTVFESSGVADELKAIAAGERRQEPLLDWKTYEAVLKRCRKANAIVHF